MSAKASHEPDGPGGGGRLLTIARVLDRLLMRLCGLALLAGAIVLTESVIVRYGLKRSTDWQDETAVYLLVAATFLSVAHVQAARGHVAIEALTDWLPPAIDRWRRRLVDALSLAFVAFFAWKSWTLAHEAWIDGTVTASTFGPPLWIPYLVMALGMSLLVLVIATQLVAGLVGADAARGPAQGGHGG